MPVQENAAVSTALQGLKGRFLSALKTHPTFTFFLLVIVTLLVVVNFLLIEGTISFKNPIAIEVNGQKISREFVEHQIEIKNTFYSQHPPETKIDVKKETIDWIIDNTLTEQELQKNNINLTNEEIEKALDQKIKNAGGSDKFQSSIAELKMNLDDQKYYLKTDLLYEKLKNLQTKKHFLGIWFQRNIPGDAPEKTTPEQIAADEKLLEKVGNILDEAKSGKDFTTLVKENSQDPVSKAKNGEIGTYPDILDYMKISSEKTSAPFPSMTVVDQAYQELKINEMKIYTYPSGYAILKVDKSIEGLGNTTYKDFVQKLKEKAKIKILI